jgi:S-formylglutathione hydrolase
MAKVKEVSSSKSFGGLQKVFSHESVELKCEMKFSLYVPPKALDGEKCPVLYFLSGLTCTEQNFIVKCGFQRYAAENNLIVVGPDTSPRGFNFPGEHDDYDFGSGAGFYLNATQEPWKTNYRMYSYVTEELPGLIESEFTFVEPGKRSISGHSMGGHGALICSLKNPGFYTSTSAFAPISNPSQVPWGQKAFKEYLGSNEESWKEWDATTLAKNYSGPPISMLVDQVSLKHDVLIANAEVKTKSNISYFS